MAQQYEQVEQQQPQQMFEQQQFFQQPPMMMQPFGLQMPQFQQPAAFSTQFQPMQFDAFPTTGSFVGPPNGQPNFVFYPEFKGDTESEDVIDTSAIKTRDVSSTKKSKKSKGSAGACGCF